MKVIRTVDYKIAFADGPLTQRVLMISSINQELSLRDARYIMASTSRGGNRMLDDSLWPGHLTQPSWKNGGDGGIARNFAKNALQSDTTREEDIRYLTDVLRGPDAVVPVFGSSPSQWIPLRDVMAHATGVFAAYAQQGGIPTAVLTYTGAVILVRLIDPIAQSAGSALADGVGAAIRRAFGLQNLPEIGRGEAGSDLPSNTGDRDTTDE